MHRGYYLVKYLPGIIGSLHCPTCDSEANWKNNTDNQWDTSYDDQENEITNEKTWQPTEGKVNRVNVAKSE